MYFSKIKKVTFGKNIAFKINDFKHIKVIITKLYDLIKTNKRKYVRITNKEELVYIKENNYLVGPNFSGIEAFYFFCKINSNLYNVVIYKENLRENLESLNFNYIQIYKIKIKIPEHIYNGTLFDGIIFNKNNVTYFVINDLILYNSEIMEDSLEEKQNICNKLLNYIPNNDNFVITMNKFLPIDEIQQLYYERIKNSDFDISGLLFVNKLGNNRIFNIYNNNIHSKTITGIFNMKKYNLTDVYILECLNNDNKLVKWGIARINNLKTSLKYQNIFKDKNNITVKCQYNLKFNKWEPIEIMNGINYSKFNNLKDKIRQII